MQNDTRVAFNELRARIAELNSVPSAASSFNVTPTIQQTLETRIQESSDFLGRVNIIGVTEQESERLGLGISGPIASRTNTDNTDRQPRDLTGMSPDRYRCEKTNYDTFIKYATLDAWAKFKDFQARVRDVIIKRQALDRIVIGFNGKSVAQTTNPATNPLLQDVNIGWLQKMRSNAPDRVMGEGSVAGKVRIGATGDYKNLDAAVFDAVQMLDPWYRNDTGLVAIVGRNLLHDKYFPLVNNNEAPTEKLASDIIISAKRVGGLPAATVPYFPENAVLITRYDNLSIYWQTGARRRMIEDNPKRDRIENYESSNDAYVVEDYGLATMIENIEAV